MENVYLDDFKLHDLADPDWPIYLNTPIDGLEFAKLRVNSHPKAGQDGTSTTSIYLDERRIQLTGKVDPNGNATSHVAYRKQVIANCAPIRTNGVLQTRTLRFTDLDGVAYRLLVQVVDLKMPKDQVAHSTFAIDLLADSGYVEAYDESSQAIVTQTRGGFILPVVLPIVFEAGTGGFATLTNDGDAPAYPYIDFVGPLTNPRLTNQSTGEFLAMTISVANGETIRIDTLEHTVVQDPDGARTNKLSALSEDSTFFAIQPGDNIIDLSTGVSGEAGTANIYWRHAYFGV